MTQQKKTTQYSYWQSLYHQFLYRRLGVVSFAIIALFVLIGIYAPFLASSKPLVVSYHDQYFFPSFRYLFFKGFYQKSIDIFFNLLMFTFPLFLLSFFGRKLKRYLFTLTALIQVIGFLWLILSNCCDPAANINLLKERASLLQQGTPRTWEFELAHMNEYAKINLLLNQEQLLENHQHIAQYSSTPPELLPTPWAMKQHYEQDTILRLEQQASTGNLTSQQSLQFKKEKQLWIDQEMEQLSFIIMPLIRPYHWEDDIGGSQKLNRQLPWWELSRLNRKDLVSSLIYGIRISLLVGITAVGFSLAIGIPLGALSGYYGGRFDIFMSRFVEIWESMPTFFMLLLIVAITQSKSIFLIVSVIGLFGWTGFFRFIRGEFFKQKNLLYVESCQSMGFNDKYIIFTHILPNAIPPLLTLIPFAIMSAITSEAGLSFLGLGEENSCSWGVLMDEGRRAFPGESYLLWPPALLLTILLIAIALVGDALRDALDPKMHR